MLIEGGKRKLASEVHRLIVFGVGWLLASNAIKTPLHVFPGPIEPWHTNGVDSHIGGSKRASVPE